MRFVRFLALAVSASSAAKAASTFPIACPAELAANAVQVVRPAPGWTGFVPSRFVLHSVGLTLGPLQERATQRGEHQELANKAYRVSYPTLGDWKGEKWLTCEYGDGGIVQAQRLPANIGRCDVLYTPDKHGIYTLQVTCQQR